MKAVLWLFTVGTSLRRTCGPSLSAQLTTLFDTELNLFRSALEGRVGGMVVDAERCISEFVSLQQKHLNVVGSMMQVQREMSQVTCYFL